MSRFGKIARLPKAVREELSRRMEDGERGSDLLTWLNGLPEVQQVVASEFGGCAIHKQNLSEWRKRGHREWVKRREVLEVARTLAEDGAELQGQTGAELSDRVGLWLAARFALEARKLEGEGDEPEWKRLRELCHDVVSLRRSDHSAQRLKHAEARLKLDDDLSDDDIIEHFQKWVQYGKVKEWVLNEEERREERLRELFGMGEKNAECGVRSAECAEEEEEEFEEGTGI